MRGRRRKRKRRNIGGTKFYLSYVLIQPFRHRTWKMLLQIQWRLPPILIYLTFLISTEVENKKEKCRHKSRPCGCCYKSSPYLWLTAIALLRRYQLEVIRASQILEELSLLAPLAPDHRVVHILWDH